MFNESLVVQQWNTCWTKKNEPPKTSSFGLTHHCYVKTMVNFNYIIHSVFWSKNNGWLKLLNQQSLGISWAIYGQTNWPLAMIIVWFYLRFWIYVYLLCIYIYTRLYIGFYGWFILCFFIFLLIVNDLWQRSWRYQIL